MPHGYDSEKAISKSALMFANRTTIIGSPKIILGFSLTDNPCGAGCVTYELRRLRRFAQIQCIDFNSMRMGCL